MTKKEKENKIKYVKNYLEELKEFKIINEFMYNAILIDLKDIEEKGKAITIFKDSILIFDYLGFNITKNKKGIGKVITL